MVKFRFQSPNWKLIAFYSCVLLHFQEVFTKQCNQIDSCSCEYDDGSGKVDLSSIGGQTGVPLIQDVPHTDSYAYSFNPCFPFTEGSCVNAAGCQIDQTQFIYYNIGDANSVTFSYNGQNLIGTYTSDDQKRTSVVTYMCDPTVDPPLTTVIGETSSSKYEFTIVSKAACPQSGPPGPSPTDGPTVEVSVSLTTGSILTIIFFSLVAVYLIAGLLFNRLYRRETGREMIPNVTFWTALPGLVRDGFRFTVAKVRRTEYEPIK